MKSLYKKLCEKLNCRGRQTNTQQPMTGYFNLCELTDFKDIKIYVTGISANYRVRNDFYDVVLNNFFIDPASKRTEITITGYIVTEEDEIDSDFN